MSRNKKNILYLLHADFREESANSIGGTQMHVRDLTLGLEADDVVFVGAKEGNDFLLTCYDNGQRRRFRFALGERKNCIAYTDVRLKKVFETILSAFRIDLVHVHHIASLSLDIFFCAHEMGIPIIASVHDFYYICPTAFLLDANLRFCFGKIDSEICAQCVQKHKESVGGKISIEEWRKENYTALSLCETIVFPSESAKQMFIRIYPTLIDKACVITHGVALDNRENEYETFRKTRKPIISNDIYVNVESTFNKKIASESLSGWAVYNGINSDCITVYVRLLFEKSEERFYKARKIPRGDVQKFFNGELGYLNSGFSAIINRSELPPEKIRADIVLEIEGKLYCNGSFFEIERSCCAESEKKFRVAFIGDLMPEKGSEMIKQLVEKQSPSIQWYTFGLLSDPRLVYLDEKNLTKVGPYDQRMIVSLLRAYHIDLICILTRCFETFCLTISEAWESGIPVIGTNIGAVGERIRKTGAGLLVEPDETADMILEKIEMLRNESDKYEQLKKAVKAMNMKSVPHMVEEYRALYEQYWDVDKHYANYDSEIIRNSEQPVQLKNAVMMENVFFHCLKKEPFYKKIGQSVFSRFPVLYRLYESIKGKIERLQNMR